MTTEDGTRGSGYTYAGNLMNRVLPDLEGDRVHAKTFLFALSCRSFTLAILSSSGDGLTCLTRRSTYKSCILSKRQVFCQLPAGCRGAVAELTCSPSSQLVDVQDRWVKLIGFQPFLDDPTPVDISSAADLECRLTEKSPTKGKKTKEVRINAEAI